MPPPGPPAPDSVGPIVEAIRYATLVEPEVMGKPSEAYFRQALDDIAVPAEGVMVVSDDPFSDLAGAKRLGMQAAFVLSGKYTDAAVLDRIDPAERPDVAHPDVKERIRRNGIGNDQDRRAFGKDPIAHAAVARQSVVDLGHTVVK